MRHIVQESLGDTASSDGGWAAFVGGATTSVSAPAEETWDAFQNSAAPDTTSTNPDPFGAQGKLRQEVAERKYS